MPLVSGPARPEGILVLQGGDGLHRMRAAHGEFARRGRELRVRVDGPLVFDNTGMMVRAALAGFGLALVMEDLVAQHLKEKRLIRVLEDWRPPFSGYHLYYPSRRQPSAAFALLVEALRRRG